MSKEEEWFAEPIFIDSTHTSEGAKRYKSTSWNLFEDENYDRLISLHSRSSFNTFTQRESQGEKERTLNATLSGAKSPAGGEAFAFAF